MTYKLRETEEFEKQFKNIPGDVQERFEDQFRQVEQNPYSIGKPLGYKWFRELKNEGWRAYYLVYDQLVLVLFVGVSGKKSQQAVIKFVKNNLKYFKEFAEKK